MKRCKVCLMVLCILAYGGSASAFFQEDFESYSSGDVYGQVNGIQSLFSMPIPIVGGEIVEHNGNHLVKLQASSPELSVDLGIPVDIANNTLTTITFDFFFSYIQNTQTILTMPTVLSGEFFLIESDNGSDALVNSLFTFNFNYNGLQNGLIDVVDIALAGNEPFSLSNLAKYVANLSQQQSDLLKNYDSVFLILTALYPDPFDEYDAAGYFDNIQFLQIDAIVPEPCTMLLLISAMAALRKRLSKIE
ncbi:hypothetical protein KDK77_04480 [bacterium]|nr:hypothetical protein [bacterium]MCP5462255.1 hypothetical protein [bacterium]